MHRSALPAWMTSLLCVTTPREYASSTCWFAGKKWNTACLFVVPDISTLIISWDYLEKNRHFKQPCFDWVCSCYTMILQNFRSTSTAVLVVLVPICAARPTSPRPVSTLFDRLKVCVSLYVLQAGILHPASTEQGAGQCLGSQECHSARHGLHP